MTVTGAGTCDARAALIASRYDWAALAGSSDLDIPRDTFTRSPNPSLRSPAQLESGEAGHLIPALRGHHLRGLFSQDQHPGHLRLGRETTYLGPVNGHEPSPDQYLHLSASGGSNNAHLSYLGMCGTHHKPDVVPSVPFTCRSSHCFID